MSNWERREINNLIPEKPEDYKRRFPKPFSSMIPADAGPDNKLATEAYVNSHSGGGGEGGSIADAVKYTSQSLTDDQKSQARANIGAGTYDKPSGGIPASDLANGVIPDVSGKENTSNKVTSLSAQSTDTQYPSAKAVVDYVDEKTPPTPTAQDEGKVLTADDEGNMEWQTPASGGGDSEAKEVTAAALCDLENRKFEKANLVDQYDTHVPDSHNKVGTHYALWKLYKDSLQNEEIIAAAFCQLNALGALASAVAPRYDRGTRTFAVDDCCMYENEFYRCTTAVSTPEPFDATKWVKTDLFTEMVRRFNAI